MKALLAAITFAVICVGSLGGCASDGSQYSGPGSDRYLGEPMAGD